MSEALFKTAYLPLSDVAAHADAIRAIHVGELDLLILSGVFSTETCARVVERLEAPGAGFKWTPQESLNPKQKQFYLLGESLTPYAGHPEGPDPDHYFDEAARFEATCRALFAGQPDPDFTARLEQTFARMSGGRAIAVPAGSRPGSRYTPATIRSLPPGCEIPVHVGNYFLTTPACRHLATLVDLKDQLSFFIPLQTPEGGGELVVFRKEWGTDVPEMTRDARGGWDERGDPWPAQSFTPKTGELLLFNGGRFYHRVSRVTGARNRWTIGGFASLSTDGSLVYYWS